MHVSPCGWYCFDEPSGSDWCIVDTPEMTAIHDLVGTCEIELLSARKQSGPDDDEVSRMHEIYLDGRGIAPSRTVLSENPFRVKSYVTRGRGPDERIWIVGHAYWNNFCVFLQYRALPNANSAPSIQAFFDIIQSIQPLAVD